MPAPTSIEVLVDSTEYSRYETGNDTITATIIADGGAPYDSEPVLVELRKARRSRDAVVATDSITLTGNTNRQSHTVSFYLPDIVDQDLLSLIRFGKYFIHAEWEATYAGLDIGTGPNGIVYLTAEDAGVDGNDFTLEIVVPGGTSSLSASLSGTAITVNLAVSGGVPIAGENRAVDLTRVLSFITGIDATFSGDGSGSFSVASGPTSFTGGVDAVIGTSADFDIRIVTVERLKRDYLFGVPLTATNVKLVKYQPTSITGVTVTEVSENHSIGFGTLVYNYTVDHVSNASGTLGSGANGTVTVTADGDYEGSAGNAITIETELPAGTSGLSVNFDGTSLVISLAVVAGVPDPGANTATLIAAAITALPDFTAVASGTGADEITTEQGPTLLGGGVSNEVRLLSWQGGPAVSITGPGTYILKVGSSASGISKLMSSLVSQFSDYVVVRVRSLSELPTVSAADELLIQNQQLDDETLASYLNKVIAWIENDFLAGVYLEPTNLVTDRDPTTIQYSAGINAPTPLFTDTDYDFQVSPLTYFVPKSAASWVTIQTPYKQLLRFDSLYGAIANTRVIDIDLEWIELSEQGGMVQLVPFNQEIAFDFVGLLWVNAIRGASELPNFWHFNLIAGLRNCTPDLQELIARKAAMEALLAIATAFRPGVGSLSLSRDGVSESVSYTTTQQYGIYTGAITAHREWLQENEKLYRAKYRGLSWCVV